MFLLKTGTILLIIYQCPPVCTLIMFTLSNLPTFVSLMSIKFEVHHDIFFGVDKDLKNKLLNVYLTTTKKNNESLCVQ